MPIFQIKEKDFELEIESVISVSYGHDLIDRFIEASRLAHANLNLTHVSLLFLSGTRHDFRIIAADSREWNEQIFQGADPPMLPGPASLWLLSEFKWFRGLRDSLILLREEFQTTLVKIEWPI